MTENGIDYEVKYSKQFDDRATETTVAVSDDQRLFAVIRNEESSHLGFSSEVNPEKWAWTKMEKLGCPKLLFTDGELFLVAKKYKPDPKTVLYIINTEDGSFKEVASFPSARDFSYPGIVKRGNTFFISYYLGDGTNSSVYLAKVKYH